MIKIEMESLINITHTTNFNNCNQVINDTENVFLPNAQSSTGTHNHNEGSEKFVDQASRSNIVYLLIKKIIGVGDAIGAVTTFGTALSYGFKWFGENIGHINKLIHGSQQVQYNHNNVINFVHWLALHNNNFQGVII